VREITCLSRKAGLALAYTCLSIKAGHIKLTVCCLLCLTMAYSLSSGFRASTSPTLPAILLSVNLSYMKGLRKPMTQLAPLLAPAPLLFLSASSPCHHAALSGLKGQHRQKSHVTQHKTKTKQNPSSAEH